MTHCLSPVRIFSWHFLYPFDLHVFSEGIKMSSLRLSPSVVSLSNLWGTLKLPAEWLTASTSVKIMTKLNGLFRYRNGRHATSKRTKKAAVVLNLSEVPCMKSYTWSQMKAAIGSPLEGISLDSEIICKTGFCPKDSVDEVRGLVTPGR